MEFRISYSKRKLNNETPAGRKKFYRAGEALREGGLKFLAFFGYFLW
jgi:hypothetical protein